jgi:hypothetical protein
VRDDHAESIWQVIAVTVRREIPRTSAGATLAQELVRSMSAGLTIGWKLPEGKVLKGNFAAKAAKGIKPSSIGPSTVSESP